MIATAEYELVTTRPAWSTLGRHVRGARGRGRRVPPGAGHQRRRGASPRGGLLRGVAQPQGQAPHRPARPARPRTGSLDRHRAEGAACAHNSRPTALGRDVRSEDLDGERATVADRPAVGGCSPTVPPEERARVVEGETACTLAPTSGVDVICHLRRADAAARRSPDEVAECVRVESGAAPGLDMGGDTIPQEADSTSARVELRKGCYVGQGRSPGCTTRRPQPPAARATAVGARRAAATTRARREVGSRLGVRVAPAPARRAGHRARRGCPGDRVTGGASTAHRRGRRPALSFGDVARRRGAARRTHGAPLETDQTGPAR